MKPTLKSNGTRLETIYNHQIWIECACGRAAPVRVSDLLALDKPPQTVDDVVTKARCSRCGAIRVKRYQIVYNPKGVMEDALQGARKPGGHNVDD